MSTSSDDDVFRTKAAELSAHPMHLADAQHDVPTHPPRADFQIPNCLPIFGGLVLGCIEADFLSAFAFCSIFQDLQDLHDFAPLVKSLPHSVAGNRAARQGVGRVGPGQVGSDTIQAPSPPS